MIALSQQLQATAQAVAFVFQGGSLGGALDACPLALRSGVQALSFVVLRQWGTAGELMRLLLAKKTAPAVEVLLGSALALLVAPRDAGADYTDFTLVNQTVEAAKAQRQTRAASGLVNAVLRRFLRERDALMAQTLRSEVARYNHPQWWIDQLKLDHPKDWHAILNANQIQAGLCLRINPERTTRGAYLQALQNAGVVATASASTETPQAIYIAQSQRVMELPHYLDGAFSVQDAAAQRAAHQLLDAGWLERWRSRAHSAQRLRVLDACAAPGGKTTHLLELLTQQGLTHQAEVLALDVDSARTVRIDENLKRLQLLAKVQVADAGQPLAWWDGKPFDAILLDAPCSASGIVRRHPDIRWLRRSTDLPVLQRIQKHLLHSLWPLLAPGGRLLYATCSVFKAEGEAVTQAFAVANKDAKWLDSHQVLFPNVPIRDASTDLLETTTEESHDGFYYALFEKDVIASSY